MSRYVIKASGEREPFDITKFKRSLHRVGARPDLIESLAQEIMDSPGLTTTLMIYSYAFERLRGHSSPTAARYGLKYALYELGPTGFIFERFMGELFKAQGYSVQLDLIIQGVCVDHEVDIIIEKDGLRFMVECKFHNTSGLKTDVHDALYTKARFEDLSAQWALSVRPHLACNGVFLATNTRFTTKASTYGLCAGLKLIGWSYPPTKSIAHLIDSLGIHPLTSITSLTREQKKFLLEQGIVLCRDLIGRKDLLDGLHLSIFTQEQIEKECQELCAPRGLEE